MTMDQTNKDQKDVSATPPPAEPKIETKTDPRVEPTAELKAAPTVEPKPEPKPETKPETTPEPKAETGPPAQPSKPGVPDMRPPVPVTKMEPPPLPGTRVEPPPVRMTTGTGNVRAIGMDLDRLGVDDAGQLYWDGQPIEARQRLHLSTWQQVAAAIVGLALIAGGIGAAAQGWVAVRDWGCRTGSSSSSCPGAAAARIPD